MSKLLGQWALLDIETTGLDPQEASIIDVGFLQFEGLKLIKKYSSLIRYDGKVPHFIQKLTSISEPMLKNAPRFEDELEEILSLYGHTILAHNANFEESYLKKYFNEIDDGEPREDFLDSIPFLGILFPEESTLKLEHFIRKFKLADKELHRGYEDSLDLLKVLLFSIALTKRDIVRYNLLLSLFRTYELSDYWYINLFSLTDLELKQIAEQIDFDLPLAISNYLSDVTHQMAGRTVKDLSFNSENMSRLFEASEELLALFPQYTFKKTQLDLALRVGQSFKNGVHALVQAPTGTGKTLGYLVPSTLFSIDSGEKVLIATGTKTLQRQIMEKDIQLLRNFLGMSEREFKVQKLVGSSNHLCEMLFREKIKDESALLMGSLPLYERLARVYFDFLFAINSTNHTNNLIVRDDLAYALKNGLPTLQKMEQEIAVDFKSCTGAKCPFVDSCSYQRALKSARDASLIIANHSLLFSWPKSLPKPKYVVVDEAHRLEQETTSAFTAEITKETLESLYKNLEHRLGLGAFFYLLSKIDPEGASNTIKLITEETKGVAQTLFEHLQMLPERHELLAKKMPKFTDIYWNEYPVLSVTNITNSIEQALVNQYSGLFLKVKNYSALLTSHFSIFDPTKISDETMITAYTKAQSFISLITDLHFALELFFSESEDLAKSFKYHDKYGYALNIAPINVGETVHKELLLSSESVVFTSATLGSEHGQGSKSIEWMTGYSYLTDPKKRFKSCFFLPSIYDYRNKAKVYLCDDVPALYHHSFVKTVLTPLITLIRNLQGRSLLLFSAQTRFQEATEILLAAFEGEIPLFIQGMGGNVIEEFKKSGRGILVGMESFGEGIDVPGDALSFVFIDKIPDLRLDYVVGKRRDFYEKSLGNEFSDYYLAGRTRSLHQKLGRLLRTDKDVGGAIIVESRIASWKGRSMKTFHEQMSPYLIERAGLADACKEIEKFILENSHS